MPTIVQISIGEMFTGYRFMVNSRVPTADSNKFVFFFSFPIPEFWTIASKSNGGCSSYSSSLLPRAATPTARAGVGWSRTLAGEVEEGKEEKQNLGVRTLQIDQVWSSLSEQ